MTQIVLNDVDIPPGHEGVFGKFTPPPGDLIQVRHG